MEKMAKSYQNELARDIYTQFREPTEKTKQAFRNLPDSDVRILDSNRRQDDQHSDRSHQWEGVLHFVQQSVLKIRLKTFCGWPANLCSQIEPYITIIIFLVGCNRIDAQFCAYLAECLVQDDQGLISDLQTRNYGFDASFENLIEAFLINITIVIGQDFNHASNHLNGKLVLFTGHFLSFFRVAGINMEGLETKMDETVQRIYKEFTT